MTVLAIKDGSGNPQNIPFPTQGPQASATSNSVIPATDSAAFPVRAAQGNPTIATGIIIPVKMTGGQIFSGGTGYVANEVITLVGGDTITVNTVSSGAVTAFTISSALNITSLPASPRTQASTTGVGTGFQLTPTYTSQSTALLQPNTGRGWYRIQPQGNPIYLAAGVTPVASPGGGIYVPSNVLTVPESGGRVPTSIINGISPSGAPVPCWVEEYPY